MSVPEEILDFIDFAGADIFFVDLFRGVTSYHCEQRPGVRDSDLPFDFQVRVDRKSRTTLVFAGRDGRTVTASLSLNAKEVADPAVIQELASFY
jgi:hypothetical protein